MSIADHPTLLLFKANKSHANSFQRLKASWEVCLKHRNIRREIPAGASSSSELAAVFVLFCRKRRRVPTKALRHFIRGHRSRAGCLSANQAMPVQFRLTAPFSHKHGGRQLAQQSLQNSAGSGQHRDAVPLFKTGRQIESAQIRRFDSRPRHQFSWAARSFRRSPASQAGEHGAKPWRSTISKSREG